MTREEEIRQKAISEQRELMESCDWRAGFIAGANWADSQSYSKKQLREMGFAFDLNGNVLSPNHLASKAAHYVIDKAEKWLENFLEKTIQKPLINDGYTSDTIDLVELKRRRLIEEVLYDFKKAMEEQL